MKKNNLSPEERLIEGIANKRMLLVLDNCEHLIEDVARVVSALLSACSALKILTTSREALQIPGLIQFISGILTDWLKKPVTRLILLFDEQQRFVHEA